MSRELMGSVTSLEEATWERVVAQQMVGFGTFLAVLVLARLWTSFTSTTFLRRRHKDRTDTTLALVDIVFSTGSMCSFVAQSIIREYSVALTVVEVCFALFYTVAALRRLWLKNYDFAVALSFSTFFDCYAVAVIAYQTFSPKKTWLTPTFMRSLSVLIRYEEVMKMGLWSSYAGEVKQRLVLSMLRFLCVTFFFACVGFCLEILGDVKFDWRGEDGGDVFITGHSTNWDATVLSQLYFVVVTLSTVGYGDLTPDTNLHQIFAIVMIVSGVAFFSSEVSAIVALRDEIDSGRGQYRRSRFRNSHIIVLGGAVTSGSATLQIFLEELLHPSRPGAALPDVVLMSETEPTEGLRRVLTSALGQAHVKFIRGSPMDQADLARADAANADMAFVLGNLSVMDHLTEAEDEDTILRASLLQRQLPGLPVRLLLLRSWAREMARTAGINPLSCLTSGVLNYCRTALAVRCPGLPVLLTTMYSKLAGDWSQLPQQMMPWVREYFTSMRHDVYGAQIGAEYDGVPFLRAAAEIYKKYDVNLLAVQSSPELGGRLCPAGLVNGHLHVLSEGDVVMCLGQDAQKVLRAVGSSSKHPEAWRKKFHAVRKAASRMGTRREVFSPAVSFDLVAGGRGPSSGSVRGGSVRQGGGHRRTGSRSSALDPDARFDSFLATHADLDDDETFGITPNHGNRAASGARSTSEQMRRPSVTAEEAAALEEAKRAPRHSETYMGGGNEAPRLLRTTSVTPSEAAPTTPGTSSSRRGSSDPLGRGVSFAEGLAYDPRRLSQEATNYARHDATWRKSDARDFGDALAAIHRFHPSRLRKSALQPVSEKTRNLCALNAKLAARAVVRDAAKAVRKQRAEGLAELGFTPWRTIARIAKTGGHVLVIVDGDLDRSRWSDLEVLLYRLRGNDGSNMRPIVVVSRSPPAVQDLILWRSIEVYVTEGCVSDQQIPQVLGFDNAASIVLLADACASDNPLLMDRRVLLATSVLEREDELTPDHMLPKVVLEFHHPKSVWHVQEARGFGSLESGLRKHICRKDGSLREGADGNRHAKADEVKASSGMSRRGSNENLAALDERRHSIDANRRRYGLGAPKDSRGAPPRRDLRSVRADIERHRRAQMNARPSLPAEWGAMGQVDENPLAGSGEDDIARSRTPLELAVRKSKENTPVASFLRGCLKFVGVLDRDGRDRRRNGYSNQYRESFQSQSRLSWVEHPESHTQYSRGNVMFRTEVSRVMATVFYTPGLMELVDALTRDAHGGEDIGHHPRIWSVPLPDHLRGKTVGHAFEHFSEIEALVVGVYRNVQSPGFEKRRRGAKRNDAERETDEDASDDPPLEGAKKNPARSTQNNQTPPGGIGANGASSSLEDLADAAEEAATAAAAAARAEAAAREGAAARRRSLDPSLDPSEEDGSSEYSSEDEVNGQRRAKPYHDYVLTAPPHTVKLNDNDKLYVIATTDWAWVHVPEMVELRKTSAVICLQRQFRAGADRRKEEARDQKLADFAARRDGVSLSEVSYGRRGSLGGIVPPAGLANGAATPEKNSPPKKQNARNEAQDPP